MDFRDVQRSIIQHMKTRRVRIVIEKVLQIFVPLNRWHRIAAERTENYSSGRLDYQNSFQLTRWPDNESSPNSFHMLGWVLSVRREISGQRQRRWLPSLWWFLGYLWPSTCNFPCLRRSHFWRSAFHWCQQRCRADSLSYPEWITGSWARLQS